LNTKLKRCYTLAIDILKLAMLVIGAQSAMSHWSYVLSGIPHGSIFGPILCVIQGHDHLGFNFEFFLALALVSSPCLWPCPQTQSP